MSKLSKTKNQETVMTKEEEKEVNDIVTQITKLSRDLKYAYETYDLLSEESLIDSKIYEIKAIQLKYHYLLAKAKELGIIVKDY